MIIEIDALTLQQQILDGTPPTLLDCREPFERELASIEPSIFIPMQQIPTRLAELEEMKTRPLVIYCHGGVRSLNVAHWLQKQGFTQAQSLAGGIDAWSLFVDPQVPRY